MFYDHKQKNGRNSKFRYFLAGLIRFYGPSWHLRRNLSAKLTALDAREDKEYIVDRVNYYNKLVRVTDLEGNATHIGQQSIMKGKSAYVLDTQEYLRWFPKDLRWNYRFGDVTKVPEVPAVVKSRPIKGDNANSVLLNLDKVRHFTFLDDRTSFREKEGRCIFRGKIQGKPNRIDFMEKFFGHPICDAAITSTSATFPAEWSSQPPISLWEHLKYRYVIALEGNDVASNMKWVMSSNSVAVCPRPVYETWFMEGRLIPGVHYIEIRPDFTDLVEKLEYYNSRPEKAEAIARNANEWVSQFLDPEREKLISLLVLDKYFRMTGQ